MDALDPQGMVFVREPPGAGGRVQPLMSGPSLPAHLIYQEGQDSALDGWKPGAPSAVIQLPARSAWAGGMCKPFWTNRPFALLEAPPQLHSHVTLDRLLRSGSHAWAETGYARHAIVVMTLTLSCSTRWERTGLVKVCGRAGVESRNQPHVCFCFYFSCFSIFSLELTVDS